MRVICIDNKPRPNLTNVDLNLIEEVSEYEIGKTLQTKDRNGDIGTSYRLVGIDSFNPYCATRFIPCSDIDETELVNHKEEVCSTM